MRTHIDHMLVQQALDKYDTRLSPRARILLTHPTTKLSTSFYKRGYWFFRVHATEELMALRLAPTGAADDVRVRQLYPDAPWSSEAKVT